MKQKYMITDWKGNEIKAGMTVVYIQIREDHPSIGTYYQGKNISLSVANSNKCWRVVDERIVERIGDRLGFRNVEKISGGYTCHYNSYFDKESVFESAMPNDGYIIAIKGVSDFDDIMPATNDLINKALNK